MDDPRTDETLMLAYRDGAAAACGAPYARHRGRLLRYWLHQWGTRGPGAEIPSRHLTCLSALAG